MRANHHIKMTFPARVTALVMIHGMEYESLPDLLESIHLLGLASSLGLSAEVGGGAGAGEEATNNGLEERVEDDLSTAEIR